MTGVDGSRCRRCGSTRWVAASLTGPVGYGGRAIKQCVPCGHYSNEPVERKDSGMIEPTEAAYEAARSTYDGIVISRGAFGYRAGHHDAIRAAVEAVWPLAVAEGRRQAAADVREVCREDVQRLVDQGHGDSEFVKTHAMSMGKAALIAEGTDDA